jgi:hypothetical protein
VISCELPNSLELSKNTKTSTTFDRCRGVSRRAWEESIHSRVIPAFPAKGLRTKPLPAVLPHKLRRQREREACRSNLGRTVLRSYKPLGGDWWAGTEIQGLRLMSGEYLWLQPRSGFGQSRAQKSPRRRHWASELRACPLWMWRRGRNGHGGRSWTHSCRR